MKGSINIAQLQERRNQLVKGRDQLMANVHVTNGAIAELERIIKSLIDGEDLCAEVVKESQPAELRKKVVAKKAEKVNSGGDKENRTPASGLTTQCSNH